MKEENTLKKLRKSRLTANRIQLLALASLGGAFLLVFSYSAMFGLLLTFTKGDYKLKITDAVRVEWTGFYNFSVFFKDDEFIQVLGNTIGLNLLMLLINFPAPLPLPCVETKSAIFAIKKRSRR